MFKHPSIYIYKYKHGIEMNEDTMDKVLDVPWEVVVGGAVKEMDCGEVV